MRVRIPSSTLRVLQGQDLSLLFMQHKQHPTMESGRTMNEQQQDTLEREETKALSYERILIGREIRTLCRNDPEGADNTFRRWLALCERTEKPLPEYAPWWNREFPPAARPICPIVENALLEYRKRLEENPEGVVVGGSVHDDALLSFLFAAQAAVFVVDIKGRVLPGRRFPVPAWGDDGSI